jgi:hypothetical protein
MSTATGPTLLCDYCNSETDAKDESVETTWQQWQCPHCGSWNDKVVDPLEVIKAEAREEAADPARDKAASAMLAVLKEALAGDHVHAATFQRVIAQAEAAGITVE